MRLLAAIVIYHPDWDLLERNIRAFCDDVEHIFVWDNADRPVALSEARRFREFFPKITYRSLKRNVGIAQALNHAWHYAEENDYDTLLTMDDDSVFEDFKTYKSHVQQHWERVGPCLCGPVAIPDVKKHGMLKVAHLITSGMLVPTQLLRNAEGYCEDFLVDAIDIELCINLRKKKVGSFCDFDSRLIQRFGSGASKKFGPLTLHSVNYSADRLYGIFRNHIITLRKYGYPLDLLWHIIRLYFIGFVVKGVLLVEKDKKKKLKAVFKGIKDGFAFKIK